MIGLGLIVVVVVLIIVAFNRWARRGGSPAAASGGDTRGGGRISLLTEAVVYVGAILLMAGGVAAMGQRWADMGRAAQVGVFAGVAAFFLLVGVSVRRVREPAIQRLVSVVWLLSAGAVGGAVLLATVDVHGNPYTYTILTVGGSVTAYATVLWRLRPRALQNLAVFAGLVVTACGVVDAAAHPGPPLAYALVLWGLGLGWAVLGWRRLVPPAWVSLPCGVVLALLAPSFAIDAHGWLYAVAIATAAAAMAASVPLRSAPLLALGSLALFGYVTAAVVRYFGRSLGVPAALAVTGLLIIALAVVTTRLARVTRPRRVAPRAGQVAARRAGGEPADAGVVDAGEPADAGAGEPDTAPPPGRRVSRTP